MKTRSFFSAVLMLFVVLLFTHCAKDDFASPLTEEQAEFVETRAVKPFKGEYTTYPQVLGPPNADGWLTIHFEAEGHATHLGNSVWEGTQMVNVFTNPQIIISHDVTFTAANGDQISGWYDGEGVQNPDSSVAFSGTMYIDEGTGRFEGVEGQLPYFGEATFTQGFIVFHDGYLEY